MADEPFTIVGNCATIGHENGPHPRELTCRDWRPTNDHKPEPMSSEDFMEQFSSRLRAVTDEALAEGIKSTIRKRFTMQKADKVWIAAGIAIPLLLRDRRQRHKIKDLIKTVRLLNLENQFMHTFVNGMMDGKVDKQKLLSDLSGQMQFLSIAKDL